MGGAAQQPDAALLSAGVGEGISLLALGLHQPREAAWKGAGEAGRVAGHFRGTQAEGQWEKPKQQLKANFQNALLLFLSPEREPFSGGDCFCLFFCLTLGATGDVRPCKERRVRRQRAGRRRVLPPISRGSGLR